LKQFDVFAVAGAKLKAVDRSFQTQARAGTLLIEFKPVKGEAIVAALSVTR
jgi:hypothetical protein